MAIPYGRQDITQDDIDAVAEVLKSDFLTQGPAVPRFEDAVTAYCGARHGVAVNSATSALHIACLALGLGPGDWLWTSPISFVASANCGVYCGAQVDFVDIDARTYNLCPDALERKLKEAEAAGRLPKIVIPVHLCGQSCDMARIKLLSQRYGFRIIEDASHAIGGRYKGHLIGCCEFSDITIFSFHPVKIITTGEGGMAVTNDGALASHMSLLRSHGITRAPDLMTHATDGPWYYQQIDIGFNYRMTDMQAALGTSQLKRIDEYVTQRHTLAARYAEMLADFPLVLPWQDPDTYSGLHLYVVRLSDEASVSRLDAFTRLRDAGIGVNVHYIPIHTQPYYAKFGFQPGDFPNAMHYYASAISLPLYPTLSHEQQLVVVAALKKTLI